MTALVEPSVPMPVKLFIVSLALPWEFAIGPANLSPNRLVLLAMLPICIIAWLNGKTGRFQLADFGLLLFAIWCAVALFLNGGPTNAVQSAGILFAETVGAYMLARRYVRDVETFRRCMIFTAKMMLCILPFALIEWTTGKNILMMLADSVLHTIPYGDNAQRMDLWRVQGPFAHPIIFGLFAASTVAFAANDFLRAPTAGRAALLCGCIWTGVTSMSSAPTAALLLQLGLVGWNYALRNNAFRWKILWAFVFAGYLVVEFGSNQTPVQFYISKFTFDQQSGWWRLAIWEYGSASVLNHPWFGIGLNDWVRPSWMHSDSVDNFWLLTAMRYGLPALALLVLSILTVLFGIAQRTSTNFEVDLLRASYLICMVAFALVGGTVHFWGAVYVWFFFLIGAGVCLLDEPQKAEGDELLLRPSRRHARSPALAARKPGEQRAGNTRRALGGRFERPDRSTR